MRDLTEAVEKFSLNPLFFASILKSIIGEDLSPKRIGEATGCSEDQAMRLALMMAPRLDTPEFVGDLRSLAAASGADYELLLAISRRAQVMRSFAIEASEDFIVMAASDRLLADRADDV